MSYRWRRHTVGYSELGLLPFTGIQNWEFCPADENLDRFLVLHPRDLQSQ